jgi:hypothetical protein
MALGRRQKRGEGTTTNNHQCTVTRHPCGISSPRAILSAWRVDSSPSETSSMFVSFCFVSPRGTAQRRTGQDRAGPTGCCPVREPVAQQPPCLPICYLLIPRRHRPVPAARLVFSHHGTVMHRSVLSHAMARPNVGLPCQELARRSSRNKRARRRPRRAMVRAG